jgi:epoxyqueuosine reductase
MGIIPLTKTIKEAAYRLGFALCRILPVQPAPHADFFDQWVATGRAGEMTYLERNSDKRRHPQRLVEAGTPAPQSMIVLGVNYHQFALPPAMRDDPSRGLIASYAWGDDYHEIIRPLLYELDAFIRSHTAPNGHPTTPGKALVDTGPVLERDWAHHAGLGFIGKNTCLINPELGSWLLLATLLIPEPLTYDPPPAPSIPEPPSELILHGAPPNHHYGSWEIPLSADTQHATLVLEGRNTQHATIGTCGRCTRCLTACPTDAFVGPYHLDPQRCISYWTIEAKSPIPRELRPHFGNRIFGCDICQEVCPWNQRLPDQTPLLAGLRAQANRVAPPLLEGFDPATPYWLNQDAFSLRFQRSPIKRAKRAGMLRNVCVALGNWGAPETVAALTLALQDPEPIARGHAAWALGAVWRRHGIATVQQLLQKTLETENDSWVLGEIQAALQLNI